MTEQRVAATRRIAASAASLYAIVSHPDGHVQIDGSGMLVAADDAKAVTEVGETFDMDMDRRPLGDIPNMAEYRVRNTVTRLIPDRLIEWTVGSIDKPPFGHVYGWQLEPVSETETDVTNYCDWTDVSAELRARRPDWPIVPVSMLEASVAKLDALVSGR